MSKLLDILQELNSIEIVETVNSWKEAVRLCFKPLVEQDIVNSEYIEAAIESGEKSDFYYLITEGLAIPHARPEDGAKSTGFSMLIIRQGIEFGNHMCNPIYCIIGLAAIDNSSHIDTLLEITNIFGDEETVSAISKLQTVSEIVEFLSK